MGDNCTAASPLPLLHAHFDDTPAGRDYEKRPFGGGGGGGFAKQFSDKSDPATAACVISADLDMQCAV
jgi:hypothetical protein